MSDLTIVTIFVAVVVAWQIDSKQILLAKRQDMSVELLGPSDCNLERQVIELNQVGRQKQIASLYYYPPCVSVTRCMGCCKANSYVLSQAYMCQPDQVQQRWVVQFAQTIGKRADGTRGVVVKRRRVSVEVHLGCRCRCRHNPTGSCSMPNQTFNEDTCNCSCTVDQATKDRCNSHRTAFGYKFWDELHCRCQCPQYFTAVVEHDGQMPTTPRCDTFYQFNETTCTCQHIQTSSNSKTNLII